MSGHSAMKLLSVIFLIVLAGKNTLAQRPQALDLSAGPQLASSRNDTQKLKPTLKDTHDAKVSSSQDNYVITAHTSVATDRYSNLRDELYTIVHGADIFKVQYSKSQTSSAKPGDVPGTGLHMHFSFSDPDLSQIPAAGVAIRACLTGKYHDEDVIIDDQPCMLREGDQLTYHPQSGAFTYVFFDILSETTTTPSTATRAQLAPPRKDIPAIAKAANGSIVSIVMSDKDGKPIAQGSGFLVSKDGVIVTNYHVISEGSSAIVKLPDGAFYVVDGVLAFDKARDVAVIKAHGQNFQTLTLGNSDRVQVGGEVVAIGNPLSLESTVSNGIVSGIRTAEEHGGKFLQVTAPISPGSSGGPLFNMAGEVVGITTLYLKGGENLNFSIPINDAKRLLPAESSKIQALPNETEPVKAQTPDAAKALYWISSHMVPKAFYTFPGESGTTAEVSETSSLSFQGCRVTIYDEATVITVFRNGDRYRVETTTTWGPFDLSNLRPDKIVQAPDENVQPPGAFLRIDAVNAIPLLVQTVAPGPTTSSMRSFVKLWFDSADLVDHQAKAWHDAIIGCGGKPAPDGLY